MRPAYPTRQGDDWSLPAGLLHTNSVRILADRGGVRRPQASRSRSRSVSPTEPFQPREGEVRTQGQHIGEPREQPQAQEQGAVQRQQELLLQPTSDEPYHPLNMDAGVQPRRGPPHGAHLASRFRGLFSTDMDMVSSSVWPRSPQPAQRDLTYRPILTHERRHLVTARAVDDAHPDDVVQDIMHITEGMRALTYEPATAMTWAMVEAIIMPELEIIQADLPLDLRYGRWEPYEDHRLVPVVHAGLLVNTAILPRSASPEIAQRRIYRTGDTYVYRQLRVTNGDSSLVESFFYPQNIIEALQELEDIQDREDERQRARRCLESRMQCVRSWSKKTQTTRR